MKKSVKRCLLLLAVLVLAMGMSVSASAKTKTVKMKACDFQTKAAVAEKKATTVKTGSYIVKVPGKVGRGYLKFRAPKTQKYTFTVSNLKTTASYRCAFGYIMKKYSYDSPNITFTKVKTQGGKASTLWYATRNDTSGTKSLRCLTSRYGTIKLSKGETVYLYYNMGGMKTFNLKIK